MEQSHDTTLHSYSDILPFLLSWDWDFPEISWKNKKQPPKNQTKNWNQTNKQQTNKKLNKTNKEKPNYQTKNHPQTPKLLVPSDGEVELCIFGYFDQVSRTMPDWHGLEQARFKCLEIP